MHEGEPQPDIAEPKEYGFEEGVAQATAEIERLLAAQDYVVITIAGSSNDVGKTTLTGAIRTELIRRNIPYYNAPDTSILSELGESFRPQFLDSERNARAIIFEAENPILPPELTLPQEEIYGEKGTKSGKQIQNNKIAQWGKHFGLPVSRVDLRLYIYRPDKPFRPTESRYADIIIRNDHAIDSPYKLRGRQAPT